MHFGRYGHSFHDGFRPFSENDGFGFSLFNYLSLFFMIGLIVLVVALIIKTVKHSKSQPNQTNHSVNNNYSNESATTIVKERYARGEISKEEYLELMDTLQSSP